MAINTTKKFLDQNGLAKVFSLIASKYATVADIEKALGKALAGWTGETLTSLATAVASMQTTVGNHTKSIEAIEAILGELEATDVEALLGLLEKDLAEKSDITAEIAKLDFTEVGGTNKVITTISQTDGKISATAADLNATNVPATALGDGYTSTNVQGILGELKGKINDITTNALGVEAGDGISVTGSGSTKTIAAKVKSGDSYIEVTEDGIASKGIDTAISTAVSNLKGNASTGYDTLKGLEDKVKANEGDISDLKTKVGTTGVADQITAALDKLDLTEVGGTGSVITTISQADGKVSATAATLNAELVANGSNVTGSTVKDALNKLNSDLQGVSAAAVSIKNGNGITVTGDGTEKTITAKAVDNDKYIEVTASGIGSKVSAIEGMVDGKVSAAVDDAKEELLGDYEGTMEDLNDAIEANASAIEALEGKVGDSVAEQIEDALDELDLTAVGGEGKVITTVSQADGKVSATAIDLTAANVKATKVGTGTAETVQGILTELNTAITTATGNMDNYALKTAAIGKAEYKDGKIVFSSVSGAEIKAAEIDCTDFIKDGMVNTVTIADGKTDGANNGKKVLLITFNTDAGKSDIEVPLEGIFNASNYYTKTESDGKFLTTDDLLALNDTEIEAAFNGTGSGE